MAFESSQQIMDQLKGSECGERVKISSGKYRWGKIPLTLMEEYLSSYLKHFKGDMFQGDHSESFEMCSLS